MEMTLGERIRKARKGNMTQAELAKLIGVHEITVRRWELGERTPNIKDLQRISEVLNVPLEDLIVNDNFKIEESAKEIRRNNLQNMAYWGSVVDNARHIAQSGDRENISGVRQMLELALSSLKNVTKEPAMA